MKPKAQPKRRRRVQPTYPTTSVPLPPADDDTTELGEPTEPPLTITEALSIVASNYSKAYKKRPPDHIDMLSQTRTISIRQRFSSRERDMLILIRAVSFFLNPVYRFWLDPKVMRDIMHEYVPESRSKTVTSLMAAGVRELVKPDRIASLQQIVKTFESHKVNFGGEGLKFFRGEATILSALVRKIFFGNTYQFLWWRTRSFFSKCAKFVTFFQRNRLKPTKTRADSFIWLSIRLIDNCISKFRFFEDVMFFFKTLISKNWFLKKIPKK